MSEGFQILTGTLSSRGSLLREGGGSTRERGREKSGKCGVEKVKGRCLVSVEEVDLKCAAQPKPLAAETLQTMNTSSQKKMIFTAELNTFPEKRI